MKHRIAANIIKTPTGVYQQAVIELADGYVLQIYPLLVEQANTVWMQGTIEVKQCADGKLVAFHSNKRIE